MERNNSSYNNHATKRTQRTFIEDGSWFFRTREGDLAGPFRDELEASTQLEVYIRMVKTGILPASGS